MASNLTAEETRALFHGTDDLIWGSLFIVTSLIEAAFYLPCMIVLHRDPDLNKSPCFQIMFHLGVIDFISMASEVIAGIWSITGWGFTVSYNWSKLVGGFGTSGFAWYAYIALIHLLAFNRAVGVAFPPKYTIILFSKTKTKLWIALCYFYAFIWVSLWMSPWASIIYFPVTMTFYFDPTKPLFGILARINWWNCVIVIGGTCVWYAAIVLKLSMLRRSVTSSQDSMRKKELHALKLAMIICAYIVINDQYWHYSGIFFGWGFTYAFAFGNYMNTLNAGVNPLVYLALNKTINRKVRILLGLKTQDIGPTSHRATSHAPNKLSAITNKNSKVSHT